MLDILTAFLNQHWVWATYFGTMVLNESAILVAFSFSSGSGVGRTLGIGFVAGLGVFTNDLILYALARYGLRRFQYRAPSPESAAEVQTIFERLFLRSTFLSLLFVKFLFGLRLILTLYLITKKNMSLVTFILFDLCGIALYIVVLGGIGWMIGQGLSSSVATYHSIIQVISWVVLVSLLSHLALYWWRQRQKSALPSDVQSS